MKKYLLLSQMQIQNANAMSSTCTIGFPAMTAWLGAVHALERKLSSADGMESVRFTGTAVSCHDCQLQVYRGPGDYRNSIIGTANPLKKKGKNFERPPFIEEGRVHLKVSLLIEIAGLSGTLQDRFMEILNQKLPSLRWAGGDLLSHKKTRIFSVEEGNDEEERAVLRSLMPGCVLIERRDLMTQAMKDGEESLDALLRFLSVHHHARRDEKGHVTGWDSYRETPGWLVPISVGFKGLTPPGQAACQRDPKTPHRFAESILTLGEFRLPCRFRHIDELLWHYEYIESQALYLCRNQK